MSWSASGHLRLPPEVALDDRGVRLFGIPFFALAITHLEGQPLGLDDAKMVAIETYVAHERRAVTMAGKPIRSLQQTPTSLPPEGLHGVEAGAPGSSASRPRWRPWPVSVRRWRTGSSADARQPWSCSRAAA